MLLLFYFCSVMLGVGGGGSEPNVTMMLAYQNQFGDAPLQTAFAKHQEQTITVHHR